MRKRPGKTEERIVKERIVNELISLLQTDLRRASKLMTRFDQLELKMLAQIPEMVGVIVRKTAPPCRCGSNAEELKVLEAVTRKKIDALGEAINKLDDLVEQRINKLGELLKQKMGPSAIVGIVDEARRAQPCSK